MKRQENKHISLLAQKCARAGLKLDDALALFTSLYIADALALHNGNVTKAADRAGISRVTVARQNRRTREKGNTE